MNEYITPKFNITTPSNNYVSIFFFKSLTVKHLDSDLITTELRV